MDADYQIRLARTEDLQAVNAIERGVFPSPWDSSAFRPFLGPLFSVCHVGESIVGYVVGRVAFDEGEVLNVAVTPHRRGLGIGRALVLTVIERMADNGAVVVYLEVREGNDAAIRLYADLGFQVVGKRARYYTDPMEDALVLALRFGSVTGVTKKGSKPRIFD